MKTQSAMTPETRIISAAMYDLAEKLEPVDSEASAAIAQAAYRLDEQTIIIEKLKREICELAVEDS